MLQKCDELDGASRKASGAHGSKSFVGQFRSHVNALTNQDSQNMPFYFHCIRPNSKKQPSAVNRDLVEQQCRSQRLIQHVNICKNPSSGYSAIDITIETVLARYSSLIREPYRLSEMADNHEKLLEWIDDITSGDDFSPSKISISGSSMVQFKSIYLVEKLELLLEDREAEAA
eukprot:jgi/Phyca11/569227/estExt2_Genewise1.C_PHYCAscaffold_310429